jgi:hypothetical protein
VKVTYTVCLDLPTTDEQLKELKDAIQEENRTMESTFIDAFRELILTDIDEENIEEIKVEFEEEK